MGLQITKTDERYGIDLEYWKVGRVTVSWHDSVCKCDLMGFVNKAQRDDGKLCVKTVQFSFSGDNFDLDIESPLTSQIYTKIKSEESWSASLDVLE